MKRKREVAVLYPKKDGGVQKYHYMKSVQNGNRRGVAALYSAIWYGKTTNKLIFWLA